MLIAKGCPAYRCIYDQPLNILSLDWGPLSLLEGVELRFEKVCLHQMQSSVLVTDDADLFGILVRNAPYPHEFSGGRIFLQLLISHVTYAKEFINTTSETSSNMC